MAPPLRHIVVLRAGVKALEPGEHVIGPMVPTHIHVVAQHMANARTTGEILIALKNRSVRVDGSDDGKHRRSNGLMGPRVALFAVSC
jgi:hypothetical protein